MYLVIFEIQQAQESLLTLRTLLSSIPDDNITFLHRITVYSFELTMPTLETKAPPPVVAVLSACVMWWIAQMPFSSADLQRSDAMTRLVIVIMLFFAAVGIGFLTPAILAFRRANTTTSPMKPSAASTLVDTGVFRISRHPMYLGKSIYIIGNCTQLENNTSIAVIYILIAARISKLFCCCYFLPVILDQERRGSLLRTLVMIKSFPVLIRHAIKTVVCVERQLLVRFSEAI